MVRNETLRHLQRMTLQPFTDCLRRYLRPPRSSERRIGSGGRPCEKSFQGAFDKRGYENRWLANRRSRLKSLSGPLSGTMVFRLRSLLQTSLLSDVIVRGSNSKHLEWIPFCTDQYVLCLTHEFILKQNSKTTHRHWYIIILSIGCVVSMLYETW